MGNELVAKQDATMALEAVALEIDTISETSILGGQTKGFMATIMLAKGVSQLRELFLTNPEIKSCIQSMQDTRLGFMTDRSPSAIAYAKRNGKTLAPYTYQEVVEACVEALLKGYRLTNNEFNIIAMSFYPAKTGKYRRIIEHPDVANFQYTTTPPTNESGYARVQGFASWVQKGAKIKLGYSEKGIEDKVVFKVKVNNGMGEDAIVGKALSKLFSRVLSRIEGDIMPESTDVDGVIDAEEITPERKPTGDTTIYEPTATDSSGDYPRVDDMIKFIHAAPINGSEILEILDSKFGLEGDDIHDILKSRLKPEDRQAFISSVNAKIDSSS